MVLILVLVLTAIFLIVFVASIGYCIYKVNELSDEIQELKKGVHTATGPQPYIEETSQQTPENIAIATQEQVLISSSPDVFERFVLRAKENRLLKLGVLFILLGFGRFLSYAFIHSRIGPIGRVVLGFLSGLLLMIFAALRINKNMIQGKLFRILGTALVIVASYGGQVLYNLFDPIIALGIIFVVSIYTAFFAMQYDEKAIVGYGLATGFLAPIITQSVNNPKLLFSYLAIVSLVGLILVAVKNWKFINIINLIGLAGFSFPYVLGVIQYTDPVQEFVLMAIYFVVIASFVVSVSMAVKDSDYTNEFDFATAVLIGYLVLAATWQFVPEQLHSITFLFRSIFLLLGGCVAFFSSQKSNFLYAYSIVSIGSIAIATGLEFSGKNLVYAYTFLATIISFIGYFITKKISIGYGLSLLLIVPILMALPSIVSPIWEESLFHHDLGILVAVGLCCIVLGIFYTFIHRQEQDKNNEKHYLILNSVGCTFLLSLVWLGSKSLVTSPANAVMLSLIVYALLGVIGYFYGLLYHHNTVKYYGTAILIGVVLRLSIIDIWSMDLIAKIATFLFIGILFVSTVFIKKRPPLVNSNETIVTEKQ